MKKLLFRTVLVLAALTACNKETDTQVPATVDPEENTPAGKVTLTFKASVSEDTRTVYVNDKTGAWEAGDEITVCVTDGESFEIVDFTTEDGTTFSGEVSEGYTTIASGVYPANDEYAVFPGSYFDIQGDGDVIGLYLTQVLEMGAAQDQGTLVPMVGAFDASTQTMSFHHVCGALKVTLSNIPSDACYFTFHANNQQLVYDFPLTADGRIELGTPVEGNDDMDLTFCFTAGSETTRTFYVPIPDGTLASGSYVTLESEDFKLLYKKVLSSAQTFNRNVIKRLPETACWTRNDDWDAYYYGPYVSSNKLYYGVATNNVDAPYNVLLLNENAFTNTYHHSIAEYLSSNSFATSVSKFTKRYTTNGTLGFNSMSKGSSYLVIVGLDEDRHFTGEYNCVEIVNPTFSTPEGWSISVTEGSRNVVKYSVPSNDTQWMNISVTPSTLETTYLNDLECAIYTLIRSRKASHESNPSNYAPRTGTQSYYFDSTGEYILLCVGIDENYRPTGEYCRLDYNFETPTEAYNAWIGKWLLSNGDTWTVSRKQANHTYKVKGLCATSSFTVEAELTADGNLLFKTQQNIGKTTYNGFDVTVNLYKRKTVDGGFYSSIGNLMQATMDGEGQSATLAPTNSTYPVYTFIGSYKNADNETKYVGYGTNRSAADVTMTRVTE